MSYFKWTNKFELGMEGLRKQFMTIVFDDSEGNEQQTSGILCRTKRGQFLISEGTIAMPELRHFNVNRIKSIRVHGQEFKPKEVNE